MLDGLDEFWHRKFDASLRQDTSSHGFLDPNERASRVAWQWVMIALTRPIDTLVITLRDPQSEVAKVIEAVAKAHGDFVQRID